MTGGHAARRVDVALMRFVDVLLALPFLLFVTAIGVAVGRADVGRSPRPRSDRLDRDGAPRAGARR